MTLHRLPLRPTGLVLAAITLTLALTIVPGGELTTRAARALAVVAFLALIGIALRRRHQVTGRPAAEELAVRERLALGRETGVAVVHVAGRRFLVGYGPGGVTRLAEIRIDGAGDRR